MAMNKKQMGAIKEKMSGKGMQSNGSGDANSMAKSKDPSDTGFMQSTNGMGAIDVGQGHKNLGKISPHHDSSNFSNQTLGAAKEAPVKEASAAGLKAFKGNAKGDGMDA